MRRSIHSFSPLVPAVFVVLALSFGCVTPVAERPWVAVSSPHFEVYSTMQASEVVELVNGLERFRALVLRVARIPDTESPIPTRITAFARQSELARISGHSTIFDGFFYPGLRENEVVLVDTQRRSASETVLHEYVHFLLYNGSQREYPLWYDEGFAEFLRTATSHEDQIAIGIVPRDRVEVFRYVYWMPLERILSAKSYSEFNRGELDLFYAQSWALVHYLVLDRPGDEPLSRLLTRYLDLLELGITHSVAFQEAFGEHPSVVSKRLLSILKRGKLRVFGIPLEALEYDRTPPAVRTPSKDELFVRLGQLLLMRGPEGFEPAREQFEAALAIDPRNARAWAGLGDALKFQDRWEEAEPHLRRAVELAPDDPLNLLDLAEYLDGRAWSESPGRSRRALLAEARALYRRCLELDEGLPEAWLMLGRTYLAPGEDIATGLELMARARRILPGQANVVGSIAEAHAASGNLVAARNEFIRLRAIREGTVLDQRFEKWVDELREAREEALETWATDASDPS